MYKLVDAGILDQAERLARDLLQRFPEVSDGWDHLATVYIEAGKFDEAEQAACTLIERFPNKYLGWMHLSHVYKARGDRRQQALCYHKVIETI